MGYGGHFPWLSYHSSPVWLASWNTPFHCLRDFLLFWLFLGLSALCPFSQCRIRLNMASSWSQLFERLLSASFKYRCAPLFWSHYHLVPCFFKSRLGFLLLLLTCHYCPSWSFFHFAPRL